MDSPNIRRESYDLDEEDVLEDVDSDVTREDPEFTYDEMPVPIDMDDLFTDEDFATILTEDVLNQFVNEYVEDEIGTIEMFDPSAIYDILGSFESGDATLPRFKRMEQPRHDIKPYQVKARREFPNYNYQVGNKSLVFVAGEIRLQSNADSFLVGHTRVNHEPIPIDDLDYYLSAVSLSEEASTKATCLGYSSLIHSVACIVVNQRSGIIEPYEGWDVNAHGLSWEVTGLNFDRRRTKADCVVNKYAIAMLTTMPSDDFITACQYSFAEDSCDTSFLNGSALDQEASPYTRHVDIMHAAIKDTPKSVIQQLSLQFSSWYSRQMPVVEKNFKYINHSDSISSVIFTYSKVINGQRMVPAPFRVLGGDIGDAEVMYKLWIRPYDLLNSIGSTFHTLSYESDPEKLMIGQSSHSFKIPLFPEDVISSWMCNRLCRYDIFRSVMIESELLAKINGKQGQYWSKSSNCGISWRTLRATSLTYYVAYHQIGQPPLSCGKWHAVASAKGVYQSPTFKISIGDIEYAKIIPARVMTMVASCFAYTKKSDRAYVIQKMCLLIGIMRWSSWQTSALLGDMRFLTLCAVSGSGDVGQMIYKASTRVSKPLSFPDFYALFLLRRFAGKYEGNSLKVTPIYGMPMRFLGLEKDMNLFTMWHIRGGLHATNCFIKLRDGVKLEEVNRPKTLLHYERQCDTIINMPTYGLTQGEFDNIMDSAPNCAYFNFFMFAALANISAGRLNAGIRQSPTRVKLENLFSDHHSFIAENTADPHAGRIRAVRVADGVTQVLQQYGEPPGIHSLLIRMAKGHKIRNIYLTHPKDSKSKNREIPQMSSHMRITQFIEESILTIYTDEEAADMMQDPEKFSIYSTKFSEIMTRHGLIRSEDKEFFCGNMHPEFMSVGIGLLARVLGSTSVVLSSAILRCDKSRLNVTPIGCDESILDGHKKLCGFNILHGKVVTERSAIENYVHMQQGVRAIAAACINTVFTTGLDIVQRLVAPDIADSAVMTTSDDAVRGAYLNPITKYEKKSVLDDYIYAPPTLMNHAMMIDSEEKGIVSSKLAEFNNVVCGPNGLLPQHFVHSHLVIQPLMGENIIDDVMSVISRARSSLSWGDSFDTCRAAYSTAIHLLMQKWLLTQGHIESLYDKGLLPTDDDQLLAGGGELKFNTKLNLLRAIDVGLQDDLRTGKIKLESGMRAYNVKTSRKSKTIYCKTGSRVHAVIRAVDKINVSRRIRGSLKPDFARKPKVDRIQQVRDSFMDMINAHPSPATQEEKDIIEMYPKRPAVRIIPRDPDPKDRHPCTQGAKTVIGDDLDLRLIKALRYCNLKVTRELSEQEKTVLCMSELEFVKWQNLRDINKRDFGIRFKSPTGRPLMRMYNDKKFIRPQTFTFDLALPEVGPRQRLWTFDSVAFPSFTPCWWGNNTIKKCISAGYTMAFGYAIAGGDITIFFSTMTSGIVAYTTKKWEKEQRYITFRHQKVDVYCPIMKDLTPIDVKHISNVEMNKHSFNPTINGSATALLNYGNYMNTNNFSSSRWMASIYKTCRSRFPSFLSEYKPDYPYFIQKSFKMPNARQVNIIGEASVTKIELTYSDKPAILRTINVTTSDPYEVIEAASLDLEMWE
jgi:hypothetical protein